MSKNIVVLNDAYQTQTDLPTETNIARLFHMLIRRTSRQVVLYDTNPPRLAGFLGGGNAIADRVKRGYRFISEHFDSGDRIFLFGFGVGAVAVRFLSDFIYSFGMLPRARDDLIGQAWQVFRAKNAAARADRMRSLVRAYDPMWVRVTFLGCFDTVPAPESRYGEYLSAVLTQLPFFRISFHNFRLSPSVQHARHALAIDEERVAFHPVLWDASSEQYQTLRQVWFAGSHKDVGGGHAEHETSDIALAWMAQQAAEQGILLDTARVAIDETPKDNGSTSDTETPTPVRRSSLLELAETLEGRLHDPRGTSMGKIWRRSVRRWERPDRPVIHESVVLRVERSRASDRPYMPWITQGEYEVEPWQRYSEWVDRVAGPVHVFLSYAREDTDRMRQLFIDLTAAGLIVWIDENLDPGTDSWTRELTSAIARAKCMVVICSKYAVDSRYVELEIISAEENNLDIHPFKIQDGDTIPFRLKAAEYIDATTTAKYSESVPELISFLTRRYLSS